MKKFLPKSFNNPLGFTLIELMVVISIIAFLAVIGIAAFTNAQKAARDGRRRADIDAIATALESNRISTGYQVWSTGTMYANGVVPTDPINDTTYGYGLAPTSAAGGTSFTVCVKLEQGNGNADVNGAAVSGGAYYCRKSQQ